MREPKPRARWRRWTLVAGLCCASACSSEPAAAPEEGEPPTTRDAASATSDPEDGPARAKDAGRPRGADARAPTNVEQDDSTVVDAGRHSDKDAQTNDARVVDGAGQTPTTPVEMPETCPASAKLEPGDTQGTLQSGSRKRNYLVHVPTKYTGTTPVPVVFDFHGYSSSPKGQMGVSGFREIADREGFLAVYPEGVGASWNVNGCCGTAGSEKLDEIAFVRLVLDALKKDACVDRKRVYATGISQGGGMAHHVACLAADVFAATAPVSSDLRTEPCTPARPITEISFRGKADTLDAYEGGHVGPPGMAGYEAIGAQATLTRWKDINKCSGTPVTSDKLCETYTTCAEGTEVSLCSIPGGDHVLYNNPPNFDVAEAAWKVFSMHSL